MKFVVIVELIKIKLGEILPDLRYGVLRTDSQHLQTETGHLTCLFGSGLWLSGLLCSSKTDIENAGLNKTNFTLLVHFVIFCMAMGMKQNSLQIHLDIRYQSVTVDIL